MQDTFLLVWRRAERFDPARGEADVWLAALLRYRAIDAVRRRRREHLSAAPPDAPSEDPDALAQLTATAEGAALQACLGQLPPDRRALLLRAFIGGRSYAELATEDGEPLGTVKARIRRALAALKICLSS